MEAIESANLSAMNLPQEQVGNEQEFQTCRQETLSQGRESFA
jgi:hypothetical protein